MKLTALLAAASLTLASIGAIAQTAPAAPTAPTAAAPAPMAPAPTTKKKTKAKTATTGTSTATQKKASTPEGIACSQQADQQNLHGKDRVKFRKKCISGMKAGEAKKG